MSARTNEHASANSTTQTAIADAAAFARLAAECALRPLLALAARLPDLAYFEMRERATCDATCGPARRPARGDGGARRGETS